jgi:hypothetical protein
MVKTIKSIRAILLAVVLLVGVFAATAAPVYAAQSIDVSTTDGGTTIGGVAQITSGGTGGVDSWTYSPNTLTLYDAGPYTLTGTNTDLYIIVDASATNANVTFDNLTIAGGTTTGGFQNEALCTVTLVGANRLSGPQTSWEVFGVQANCTIDGSGTLSIEGVAGALDIGPGYTLTILGSASVSVDGMSGSQAIEFEAGSSLVMGDNASLTITNGTGTLPQYTAQTFNSSPGSSYQWVLSGAATTTDSLTGASITVTIPAGATGTIKREPIPGGNNNNNNNNNTNTTGTSPKTDDATGMNAFLIVMMLLLTAGAVYTGRKAIKTKR